MKRPSEKNQKAPEKKWFLVKWIMSADHFRVALFAGSCYILYETILEGYELQWIQEMHIGLKKLSASLICMLCPSKWAMGVKMKNRDKDLLESLNQQSGGQGRRKRQRGAGTYVLGTFGCLAVLALVMYLGTRLYAWLDQLEEKEAGSVSAEQEEGRVYTQEELDAQVQAAAEKAATEATFQENQRILGELKNKLSSGETTVETLRPLYPEELVLVSNGTFHFVPIREDLQKNALTQENLNILESGEYQYLENGEVVSHKGIDVSRHQGVIDWEKVSAAGVEFAFLRVGYRGYGNGAMVADEQFESNIKGAVGAGVKVGVYYFSQAVSEEEALEEAAFVLEQIAPYKVECPVVFDVEKVADEGARMNQITVEERTRIVRAFCDRIQEAGYIPMIYHNMEMGVLLLDLSELEGYEKWFAYYSQNLYYPYAYRVWQYSDTGVVDGIGGPVDLNISLRMWES